MSSYEALAQNYDGLTQDVDYQAVADYLEAHLTKAGLKPKSIVDLGCGTGSLSVILAQKGYQVTGVDLSEDMLSVAWEKAYDMGGNRPFFVCQPMEELELPNPVDVAVCCLDSLNYVTNPDACKEAIRRTYENLTPGGLFFFDINSVEKLKGLDGQIFLDENEDSYCVWRAEFDQEENICYYGMDIFTREDDIWLRDFEEHLEYAYSAEQLTSFLTEAGFQNIQTYGDRTWESPRVGEQRIYFTAHKPTV